MSGSADVGMQNGATECLLCSVFCFSLVSLTLVPQPSFTLFAIMFLTFSRRTVATLKKKQGSRGDRLIMHWHVSCCMIAPERQKQNTCMFLADTGASWCEMHWSSVAPISCLNRHEYFNCMPHSKLPHFLRHSVVYREISQCHYVKWLAKTSTSQTESGTSKKSCSRHTVLRFQIHLFVKTVWNYHHNSSHYFVSVNACLAQSANVQGQARGIMNVVRRAIHFGNSGQPREWMARW